MSAAELPVPVEAASLSSTRLERVLHATLKRNLERPPIDWSLFDAAKIPQEQSGALAFVVTNLAHIETASTLNLASIAAASPVPAVSAVFAAQVHDEIAHGTMLSRWLSLARMHVKPHPWTRFGVKAAALTQRNAWLGIRNAEILTEHYASALLEELTARVDEPCLRSILLHIQKDEQRHKVIAAESLRALREARCDKSVVARVLGPVVEKGTVAYFRHVFGRFVAGPCAALALPHKDILARALDEVADAVRDG